MKKFFLGDSRYPLTMWLRIPAAIVALIVTVWTSFILLLFGIVGIVLMAVVFLIVFGILTIPANLIGKSVGTARLEKENVAKIEADSEAYGEGSADANKARLTARKYNTLLSVVATLLLIGGIVLYIAIDGGDNFWPVLLYIIVGVVICILIGRVKQKYKLQYEKFFKDDLVTGIVDKMFENPEYIKDGSLPEKYVMDSKLFDYYTIYSGNDYIESDFNHRRIFQSDIHLVEEQTYQTTDSDGDTVTQTNHITVFQGRLTVLDYDAVSDEPVFVYDKRTHKIKGEAVETEHIDFNKKFVVTAQDAQAVFKMLTPKMMEGIVEASNKTEHPISMSFIGDKLYIAIESGDLFEGSAVGEYTLSEQREEIVKEFTAILGMLDCMPMEV